MTIATKLFVGAAACILGGSAANAAPIVYTFDNPSYAGGGNSANLSGVFTWDASTNRITSSSINVTGVDGGATVNCTNCNTGLYDPTHFAIGTNVATLYITFGASLSDGGPVPLSLKAAGHSNQPEYQGRSAFTSVSGAAVVAAVPEAATWAMMIVGIGAVGVAMRRQKVATRVSYAA